MEEQTIQSQEYSISTDKQLLNEETICRFLSESYWASQRPVEKIRKSIETSYCFGVYDQDRQIGFARVVTDWAVVFHLCDVYIDQAYRGQGIGTKLVEALLKGLKRRDHRGSNF